MQTGVKQNMKFPPPCNFYNNHGIQHISKPLLTAIKSIYSPFPMPCREQEKSWAEANPYLTENKASPFQILSMNFEHTEVYIR